jgi:hypothetical protein
VNNPHDLAFGRSSYCSGGHCVEVASLPDGQIALRDSKDLTAPHQVFTQTEWILFVQGVKAGEFDFGLTIELPDSALTS